MKLITRVTLGDHFIDCVKRSYSSAFNLGMPAALVAFNLMDEGYRAQLTQAGVLGFIVAYLYTWMTVNCMILVVFMAMSAWGPLRNSRGTFELTVENGNIVERGPTNIRMIEISSITAVKTDHKVGAQFKLKNGKNDLVFFRGNAQADIRSFLQSIEQCRMGNAPPLSTTPKPQD
jgi:hypothetical protein